MASEFSNSTDVPDHSYQPCRYENVYIRLRPVMRVVLVIAVIVTTTTLLMIACHRRVRKQHNIFRFNIVFSNLLFVGCECLWEVAPNEFWEHEFARFIFRFIVETSIMVAMASISMVAVYQYISIRVDPFGAKNILTTTRCVVACVVCWAIMFTIALISNVIFRTSVNFLAPSAATASIFITGICYTLIYQSISRVIPTSENIVAFQRADENRRVMRTYALVFVVALILCVLPEWLYVGLNLAKGSERNYYCVRWFWGFMPVLHAIANPLIYWWRLKEFRGLLPSTCKRNTVLPVKHIVL